MMTSATAPADALPLRECLDPIIVEAFRDRSSIIGIDWQRFALATSYAAHLAIVHLADGEQVKLFAKDFSSTVRAKDGAKQRREREVRVYRDLLRDVPLGFARYYGSVLEEHEGQLWLLLEYVDGTPVGYCDIAQFWAPAAAALGRLHGFFAGKTARLSSCEYLINHTDEFFRLKAEEAVRAGSQLAPDLIVRLERLAHSYDSLVDTLASLPKTLVQGGCRPTNILINVVSDPSRICIIDWEEAGVGSPFFDLAHLLDGIEPPMLDRLLQAHRQEALAQGLVLPTGEDAKYLVDCFRLYMTINSLSRAVLKGYDARAVAKLLRIGEEIAAVLSPRSR